MNMKYLKGAGVAIIGTIICGCAQTVFVHDNKNAQAFERDKYDCQLVAAQSAANWGSAGNPFIIASEMQKCLKMKHGWREQRQ
jgi:hypothetical protein